MDNCTQWKVSIKMDECIYVENGPNQSNLNFIWLADVGMMEKKVKGKAREDTNVPALSEK